MSTNKLHEFADRLFVWTKSFFTRGNVKDVFVWTERNTPHVALSVDAYKFRSLVQNFERPWNNKNSYLDHRLAQALGIEQQYNGRNVSPQFLDEGEIYLGQFFDGLSGMLSEAVNESRGAEATMIPEPGRPYAGSPTTYYSAAKKRTFVQGKPAWAVEIEYEGKRVSGANYCVLSPRINDATSGAAWFEMHGRTLFASHSLDLTPKGIPIHTTDEGVERDVSADAVKACGGLLFPSVAIGELPASNFGACTILIDPLVALRAVKPYRKPRENYPAAIYSSDAWTETTIQFVGSYSYNLYLELTGHAEWLYAPNFYIFGPRLDKNVELATSHFVKMIDSTQQIVKNLDKRMKLWKRGMSEKQVTALLEKTAGAAEHYPFVEAKFAAVLGPGAWTGAVCADFAKNAFDRWLHSVGYRGTILAVETTQAIREGFYSNSYDAQRFAKYELSWRIADAVRANLRGGPL